MGKIILVLILAAVAFLVIRSAMRGRSGGGPAEMRADAQAENMKECARCGLNVPRSEALEAGGRYYCSEDHRRLGAG